MSGRDDKAFIDELLKRKLVTRGQLDECRELLRKSKAMGVGGATLGDTLVSKGFLTPSQAREARKRSKSAAPARTIAGYELRAKLGQGGMGVVYRARQEDTGREVALKLLSPKVVKNRQWIDRFIREARAAGSLNHPNIVRGLDVGCSPGGDYYFVMEFVKGSTVRQVIKRQGTIPLGAALSIVKQIADGLEHARKAGIIHRDVKPDNIMVMHDGTAKLADLGLAKSTVDDATVTMHGQVIGTPHYLSPEQARGRQDIDTRTDIYSLGATFFHMVTGRVPFGGDTPAVIMTKHISEPVPLAHETNPDVPVAISRIIATMMAKDPDDRYQTPEEIAADIEAFEKGERPVAGKAASVAPRRRRVPRGRRAAAVDKRFHAATSNDGLYAAIGVVLGLLLLAGGAAVAFWPRHGGPAVAPSVAQGPSRERLDEAAAALDAALAAHDEQPGRYSVSIPAFRKIADDFDDTPSGKDADELIDKLVGERNRKADAEIKKRMKTGVELTESLKLGDALRVFNGFPAELSTAQWRKQVEDRRKALGRMARDRFKAELEAADKLEQAGEYAQALAKCEALLASGFTGETAELRTTTDRLKSAMAGEHAAAVAARWEELRGSVAAWRENLKHAEALKQIDEFTKMGPPKAQAERAEQIKREFELIRDYMKDVELAIAARKGSPTLLGKTRYVIEDAKNGVLHAKGRGGVEKFAIHALDLKDIEKFAKSVRKRDARSLLSHGVYMLAVQGREGAPTVARIRHKLESASKAGADAAPYMGRLAAVEQAEHDGQAKNLLAQAKGEQNAKTRAETLRRLLADYPETPTVKTAREEIDALLAAANAPADAPTGIAQLLRGKVSQTKLGAFLAEYSFANPEQMLDWHAEQAPGGAKPAVLKGQLHLKGASITTGPVLLPRSVELKLGTTHAKNDKIAKLSVQIVPVDLRGEEPRELDPSLEIEISYLHDTPTQIFCRWKGHEDKDQIVMASGKAYPLRIEFGKQTIISFNGKQVRRTNWRANPKGAYRVRISGMPETVTWTIDDVRVSGWIDAGWLDREERRVAEERARRKPDDAPAKNGKPADAK